MTTSKFKVMLAKDYNPKRVENWKEMFAEPKLDGVRVIATLTAKGRPQYFSRNGRELMMFSHLNKVIMSIRDELVTEDAALANLVLDGEMMSSTFGEISGAIHRKEHVAKDAVFHVFHCMPLKLFRGGMDCMPQIDRGSMLKGLNIRAGVVAVDCTRVMEHRQVRRAHDSNKANGYEGTMVKNLCVPWVARRTWDWMKIKDKKSIDVRVTGMKEGTGKYEGMCGALFVDHNGKKVRVSGMDDAQRKEFWENPRSIVGRMIEVEYQEETVHGSLRHPRFKTIRSDKE